MSDSVTIPLLDTESPSYSRTVVKIGEDSYLIVGMDRARGLIALEKLPPEPVREVPEASDHGWPWRRRE